jgi:hypothetical protein
MSKELETLREPSEEFDRSCSPSGGLKVADVSRGRTLGEDWFGVRGGETDDMDLGGDRAGRPKVARCTTPDGVGGSFLSSSTRPASFGVEGAAMRGLGRMRSMDNVMSNCGSGVGCVWGLVSWETSSTSSEADALVLVPRSRSRREERGTLGAGTYSRFGTMYAKALAIEKRLMVKVKERTEGEGGNLANLDHTPCSCICLFTASGVA